MENLQPFDFDYKRLKNLILYLSGNEGEEDWFDFKLNYADPDGIGEYVSSLSNAATICGHEFGYLIWGVDDQTHELRGTSFNPAVAKKGNEELESYLSHMSTPRLDLRFYRLSIDGRTFVVLQIPKASKHPVSFAGTAYIRVGSSSRPLSKYPEKEMKLWLSLASYVFETAAVKEELTLAEAFGYLDYGAYFMRRGLPIPSSFEEVASTFLKERYFALCDSGAYAITNLGALLFAKDFADFPSLLQRSVRVIRYVDQSRVEASSENEFRQGYAVCFEQLVRHILALQNQREVIGTWRESVGGFPEAVIRETLANALVHQDFTDDSISPLIEIFPSSIVATNSGRLLVDASRLLDATPVCRNPVLARSMRLMRMIEDRGSGFDRIEENLAAMHAPSARVSENGASVRVSLIYGRDLSAYSESDVLNTIYTSCCFGYVNSGVTMGNAYFRARLGAEEKEAPVVSRLLGLAVENKLLKIAPGSTGVRNRYYLPYWA